MPQLNFTSPFQLLAAGAYGGWLALLTPSGDAVYWSVLVVVPVLLIATLGELMINPSHPRINPLPLLGILIACGVSVEAPAPVQSVAGGLLAVGTGGVALAFLLGRVIEALDGLRQQGPAAEMFKPSLIKNVSAR